MGMKRTIHGVDLDQFVVHISQGAELLKNFDTASNILLDEEEKIEDVIRGAEVVLFRRALLGEKSAHRALFILNPEKYDRIKKTLERYDYSLNLFEEAAPHLRGSVAAEVTEENVRQLFFALLGIELVDEAFKFLEQMWQYISWKSPKEKIPGSTFNCVFSALMAADMRDEAYALLNDGESFIDWSASDDEVTVTIAAAMEIFSVFLALDKYALAKRVIKAMRPIVNYPEFLLGLQTEMEKSKEEQIEGLDEEIMEVQNDADLKDQEGLIVLDQNTEKTIEEPVAVETTDDQALLPVVSMLHRYPPPPSPDFQFNFELPVWDTEDSPIGTITWLNENLHEMLSILVKNDGVRCLHDIPQTVREFQVKFPRYADERFEKKIVVIVRKVTITLENPQMYRQQQKVQIDPDESELPKPNKDKDKPADFKKKQAASFFHQKKKKRRASR